MAQRGTSSGNADGVPGAPAASVKIVREPHAGPADTPDTPEMAELAALVQRAAAGDQRAWGELVQRYAPRVFAMARSRLGEFQTAEDIVQSVFATLARTLNNPPAGADRDIAGSGTQTGYEERGRFEAWLFRITMNRVRDEARRRKSRAVATDPDAIVEQASSTDVSGPVEPGPSEGVAALRRAMAGLSEADREIVELRHHAQMAFKDIAELLGQPIGTVLARHHRALKKLRELMEPRQ